MLLVAFVVTASAFALVVIASGIHSSGKSRETVADGLSQARGTLLVLRGDIVAEDTDIDGNVDIIYLSVATTAGGENMIDLKPGKTVIRYTDIHQSVLFDTAAKFSVTALGNADADNFLERGEMYELALLNIASNLTTMLTKSSAFLIEVFPPKGVVLRIERVTPPVLDKFNILSERFKGGPSTGVLPEP